MPALEFIRDKLDAAAKRQSAAAEALARRTTRYKNNPQLARLVEEYAHLAKAINEKKRDLANLGPSV